MSLSYYLKNLSEDEKKAGQKAYDYIDAEEQREIETARENEAKKKKFSLTPRLGDKPDILQETWNTVNKPFQSWDEVKEATKTLDPKKYEPKPRTAGEIFVLKALDSMTMGIPEAIETYENRDNPEALQRIQTSRQMFDKEAEKHPVASFGGTLAGYIGPGGIASLGAKTVAKPILKNIVGTATRIATQEAIAGAGLGAIEGATRGYSAGLRGSDLFGNVAKNTAIGGALGGIIGGGVAKVGQGINAIRNIDSSIDDIFGGMRPSIEGNTIRPIPGALSAISDVTAMPKGQLLLPMSRPEAKLRQVMDNYNNPVNVNDTVNVYPSNYPKPGNMANMLPEGQTPLQLKSGVFEQPPAKPVRLGEAPQGKFTIKPKEVEAINNAKEPWQMTKEEFAKQTKTVGNIRPEINFYQWAKNEKGIDAGKLELDHSILSPDGYISKAQRNRTNKKIDENYNKLGKLRNEYDNLIQNGTIKKIEFQDNINLDTSSGQATIRALHKREIRKALSEGKPVPQEVLKDYPEIRNKYTITENITTTKEPRKITDFKPQRKTLKARQQYNQQLKQAQSPNVEKPNFNRENPYKVTPGQIAQEPYANITGKPPKVPEQFKKETFVSNTPQKKQPTKTQQNKTAHSNVQSTRMAQNTQGSINSNPAKNEPVKTQNNANSGKYPKEIQDKLDALDAELKYQKEFAKRNYKYADDQARHVKGQAMKISAEKKKIISEYEKTSGTKANNADSNAGKDINASTKMEASEPLTEANTPKSPEPPQAKQTETPKQKISQTRTNTIERAKDISDKSRSMLDEKEFGYEQQTVKEWRAKAAERFTNDKQGIVDDLMSDKPIGQEAGKEVMEASMIIKEAEQEAIKTGKFDKLLSYTKKYAEKIRENARVLKAHDMAWEKNPTPSNAIIKAQNTVTKSQDEILKSNPKLQNKIENDVKAYKEAVDKTIDAVTSDTMKYIKLNLQLFGKKLAGNDKKLAEYIKKYYTSDPLERADTINKIVKEFGLSGNDAKVIKKAIENVFDNKFEAQSKKYMESLLKSKNKQNVTLEKTMKLIKSGAYNDTALADIIKQKYGLPVLTPDEAKTILTKMSRLEKLDKESNAYRLIFGQVQKIIADKTPATLREKFRGMQRIIYLSNPKTLLTRNPIGNVILNLAENVKDAPGSVIDMVTSAVRKSERTTLFNPVEKVMWQGEGFKKGYKDWLLDVKYKVDTSPTRGQLELPSGRTFDSETLNAIDELVRKSLQLGDRPFYEAAYNSRLKELMKIKKTDGVTDELKADARLYALDRVFQGDTLLAKKAGELRKVMGLPGDIIMPFTQTPANVLDKLLDYSGGGLVKALVQIGRTASKGTEFNQKLFVDRLARTFTGGTLIGVGYALASKDLLTGAPDKNEDKRNFEYSIGKTPYSVKLGDNYFTFDWAQPISGLLAMGADAYFAGKSKEDLLGKITAGAEAGINTTFKQSFLRGFFNLLSGYSPAASITRTLGESALGLTTPTAGKQITRIIDPMQRETYSESKWQETANKIIKNIPLWSKSLPAKIGTDGKAVNDDQGVAINIFQYMFNPGRLTEYKPTNVQKEILRVYDKTDMKGIFPSVAEKTIKDKKGETHKLTTEQFQRYQTLMGKYVEETMNQVINSNSSHYKKQNTTDIQRAMALKQAVSDGTEYAKEVMLKEMGLTSKTVKRKKNPVKVPDNSKKKY